jgi:hypothetical protein
MWEDLTEEKTADMGDSIDLTNQLKDDRQEHRHRSDQSEKRWQYVSTDLTNQRKDETSVSAGSCCPSGLSGNFKIYLKRNGQWWLGSRNTTTTTILMIITPQCYLTLCVFDRLQKLNERKTETKLCKTGKETGRLTFTCSESYYISNSILNKRWT